MKKAKLSAMLLMLILAALVIGGCGSKPAVSGIDELDAAIRDTSNYLNNSIPAGNKIVILNVQSDSQQLSEYIIDELIANAVNDRIFSVVDRHQLDAIRAEQNFQMSGEVGDDQALEIGRFFGAQTIVSGGINRLGTGHRIRIRALNVETAVVQGQFNRNIVSSELVTKITTSPVAPVRMTTTVVPAVSSQTQSSSVQAVPAQATTAPAAAPAAPVIQSYRIGDTGPAGGIIFHDKRNNSGGWRYLEAAPVEAEFQAIWSVRNTSVANTAGEIGTGRRNTQLIVEVLERTSGEWDTAAQKVAELEFGGFDDWFTKQG